ncbi:hypothetical protein [Streptomyces sp. NPDC002159]
MPIASDEQTGQVDQRRPPGSYELVEPMGSALLHPALSLFSPVAYTL